MTSEDRPLDDISTRAFYGALVALTLLFLAQQITYVLRFPLIMDEFVDAQMVKACLERVPYRDFPSTKTVLGYYIQAPAMALVTDAWRAMLAIKIEMALLTTAALLYAAIRLSRYYMRAAVILGLALIFSMSTFNERCSELRSDMPTSAFGLIALILLIEERPLLAGVFTSVSLMMSQKAAYYVVSSEAALIALAVVIRNRERIRQWILFNAGAILSFGAYLAFWSIIASPAAVFGRTFVGPSKLAFTPYTAVPAQYWPQTLERNPFYYALAIAALIYLAGRGLRRDPRALLLGAYGSALLALCVWHKQPWPYFFVILIPTLFVVHVPFLEAAMRRLQRERAATRRTVAAAAVLLGIVIPVAARLPATLARDNRFQHSMFRIGSALLATGGQYLAGTPIFYDHEQAVADELNSIDNLEKMRLWSKSPEEMRQLIHRVDTAPIKFLLYNYRLQGMPPVFRRYLQSKFAPYWGDIFLYAPRLSGGPFTLKFGGRYLVSMTSPSVVIDGRPVQNGAILQLGAGTHTAVTTVPFGLAFLPTIDPTLLDPNSREYQEFFESVYSF